MCGPVSGLQGQLLGRRAARVHHSQAKQWLGPQHRLQQTHQPCLHARRLCWQIRAANARKEQEKKQEQAKEGEVSDCEVEQPIQDKAPEFLDKKHITRLDAAFHQLEEKFNVQQQCALEEMVGEYEFTDKEKNVFRYLVSVLRRLAFGNFLLAIASTALVISQAAQASKASQIPYVVIRGFSISSIAYILDAAVAGLLVWMAAVSFKKAVTADKRQQLPDVFQGIMQIGVLFTQVTTVTLMLAVVQMLEAAVRWPDVTVVAAFACAIVAGLRTAALGLVMTKYTPGSGKATMAIMGMRDGSTEQLPLIDRAALMTVGGLLLPFSVPMDNPLLDKAKESSVSPVDAPEKEDTQKREEKEGPSYEFSRTEKTILEVVMDSMRMCAVALALQFVSTSLLGISMIAKGEIKAIQSFSAQLLDQGIRAALLFASAGCFHRVLMSEGRDMQHLIEGLGREAGLGLLFFRMQSIAYSVAFWKSLEIVVPWIWHHPAVQRLYHWILRELMGVLPGALSNLLAKVA